MNEREWITAYVAFSLAISFFMVLFFILMIVLVFSHGAGVMGVGIFMLTYLTEPMKYDQGIFVANVFLGVMMALSIISFLLFLAGYMLMKSDEYKRLFPLWLGGGIMLTVIGAMTVLSGILLLIGGVTGVMAALKMRKITKEEKHGVPERFVRQKVSKGTTVSVFFIVLMLLLMSILLLVVPAISLAQYRMLKEPRWEEAGENPYSIAKDTDHDGLSDIAENYIYGTNITMWDTDGDYMPDGWEARYAKKDNLTHELHPNPNEFDPFDNPDGDGFDYTRYYDIFNDIFTKSEGWGKLNKEDRNGNGRIDDFWINESKSKVDKIDKDNELYGAIQEGGFVVDIDTFWEDENLTNFKEFYLSVLFGYPLQFTEKQDILNIDKALNPASADTDGDGMDDGYESFFYLSNSLSIPDKLQFDNNETAERYGKNPLNPIDPDDAVDDPETPDYFENDPDDDGLANLEEYQNGTYPHTADSDRDSWEPRGSKYYFGDYEELQYVDPSNGKRPDPANPDSDGDHMPDGWEFAHNLFPCNASDQFLDSDGDGLQNFREFSYPDWSTNYWTHDYNRDGKISRDERRSTDPFNPDTDGDGMPDGWEALNARVLDEYNVGGEWAYDVSLNPTEEDAYEDVDGYFNGDVFVESPDGLSNIEEYYHNTNPNDPDTDDDRLLDGEELKYGFHGELIGDIFYTMDFAGKYFTNASSQDTDMDSNQTNASRHLYDWEEIHGMQFELIDGIDNDGDMVMMQNNGVDDDGDGVVDDGREGIPAVGKPEGVDEDDEGKTWKPTNASNPDTDIDGIVDEQEIFGFYWIDPLDEFTGWLYTDPTNKDTDFDGLKDREEINPKQNPNSLRTIPPTNPMLADSDDDDLLDGLEVKTDFFPFIEDDKVFSWLKDEHRFDDNDDDGDGVWNEDGFDGVNNDYDNYTDEDPAYDIDFTDPRNPDTDGDGMPDGWEAKFGANLTKYGPGEKDYALEWLVNPLDPTDKYGDPDHDGLPNIEEYRHGCDPLDPDTDGDGLPDGWEVNFSKWSFFEGTGMWGENLDPANADSDFDGIPDGDEDYDDDGYHYRKWDPDRKMMVWVNLTFNNTEEYMVGVLDEWGIRQNTTDPNDPDTDKDNMNDGWEIYLSDPDGDRMPTGYEKEMAEAHPGDEGLFDPESNDTNGNGKNDGWEDWDSDGYLNWYEANNHTDCMDKNDYPQPISRFWETNIVPVNASSENAVNQECVAGQKNAVDYNRKEYTEIMTEKRQAWMVPQKTAHA